MGAGLVGGGFGNIAARAKMVSWNPAIVSWARVGRNNWDGALVGGLWSRFVVLVLAQGPRGDLLSLSHQELKKNGATVDGPRRHPLG
jgi:hypothetical protein